MKKLIGFILVIIWIMAFGMGVLNVILVSNMSKRINLLEEEQIINLQHSPVSYHENFDSGHGAWHSELQSFQHFEQGGYKNGFVRCSEPAKSIDYMHQPQMGLLHLVFMANTNGGHSYSILNSPDLRDAEVVVCIRGVDFEPNGAELYWWSQAQNSYNTKGSPIANWAYTGISLTSYLLDGKWHKVHFTLTNSEKLWTYAGSNPKRYGKAAQRYGYFPLNRVLADNNMCFGFVLAGVDENNPPTGSIDFDEFAITFNE